MTASSRAMEEVQRICDEIQRALPSIKPGTMRFWGSWFGRPYDGFHQITGCEQQDGVLKIRFKQHEQLKIWAPQDLRLDDFILRIRDAERVLLEWPYVGRHKTGKTRFFFNFVKQDDTVIGSSSVDWYEPDLRTDLSFPAVEILSLVMPRL